MNEKGTTLFEWITTMILITILFVAAMPIFTALLENAKDSQEEAVIANIRVGIQSAFVSSIPPAYPTVLDSVTTGNDCLAGCFIEVLNQPLKDSGWQKASPASWTGPTGSEYTYNSSAGTLLPS